VNMGSRSEEAAAQRGERALVAEGVFQFLRKKRYYMPSDGSLVNFVRAFARRRTESANVQLDAGFAVVSGSGRPSDPLGTLLNTHLPMHACSVLWGEG
jgi:hypothetical protein